MKRNQRQVSVGSMVICLLVIFIAIALRSAYIGNEKWYWMLAIAIPILAIAIWREKKRKSNFITNQITSYAKNKKQPGVGKRRL
jgi:hypothetical protein